jgi:lipopolysaccharide export system protein LptA
VAARVTRRGAAALALLVALAGAPAAGAPTPAAPGGDLDGLLGGFALDGNRGPVRIDADAMEFDYKTKILTYRGTVSVTQADLNLRSDVLRVELDLERPDRPREIVAEGNVQIVKGERRASGGRAVFDEAARTVTLSERALLQDGQNEVAGERVIIYLDEERSVVEGGRDRVRAVLYPRDDAAGGTAGAGGTDEP